jgi:hypothetical protein
MSKVTSILDHPKHPDNTKAFAFDFDLRTMIMQSRQVRDGDAMLMQSRTDILTLDGSIERGKWSTTAVISNYGQCFDDKPSLLQRIIAWFY